MTRPIALPLCLFLIVSAVLCGRARGDNVDLVTLPKREGVQLTIYNSADLTLVKERRHVTLKRGVTDSMDLWEWRKMVEDGRIDEARKDGSIVLYDAAGDEISRFSFVRGWPSKWKGPDVNVTGNDVAIEEISIAHEGFTRSA